MAYTKSAARHDQILLGGVDASNSFRQFGFAGENTVEDVTGFSVTGNQETIPGVQTTGFEFEAFYTPQLEALLEDVFFSRSIIQVSWQPDGLITLATPFKTYVGNCYLNSWNPNDEVGGVRVMTGRFDAADATGITSETST